MCRTCVPIPILMLRCPSIAEHGEGQRGQAWWCSSSGLVAACLLCKLHRRDSCGNCMISNPNRPNADCLGMSKIAELHVPTPWRLSYVMKSLNLTLPRGYYIGVSTKTQSLKAKHKNSTPLFGTFSKYGILWNRYLKARTPGPLSIRNPKP